MEMNDIEQKILDLYNTESWSPYQIAEELGTYPNKIRRTLKKLGVTLRNSKEAQKNALITGRSVHPTEGTVISEDTKEKISRSQGLVWDNLTEEERSRRSDIGKEAWDKKTEQEKDELLSKAQDAIRESSKSGSKLEKFLLSSLSELNLKVEFHKEHWLQNRNLQVDLYLPEYRTAIEVDGPSHFKPVWGQKNLERNMKSDREKTGLVLGSGLVMVRIRQHSSLTQRYARESLKSLLDILEKIQSKYPPIGERYFEIGV